MQWSKQKQLAFAISWSWDAPSISYCLIVTFVSSGLCLLSVLSTKFTVTLCYLITKLFVLFHLQSVTIKHWLHNEYDSNQI